MKYLAVHTRLPPRSQTGKEMYVLCECSQFLEVPVRCEEPISIYLLCWNTSSISAYRVLASDGHEAGPNINGRVGEIVISS